MDIFIFLYVAQGSSFNSEKNVKLVVFGGTLVSDRPKKKKNQVQGSCRQ